MLDTVQLGCRVEIAVDANREELREIADHILTAR